MKAKKKKWGPEAVEFKPTYPEKYKGKWPIIARSSLERAALFTMDTNPSIVSYTSESLVIPYYDLGKKKKRRYFTDLTFKIKDQRGIIHSYVVEVKMEKETHKPTKGKRQQQKTFIRECFTYATNKSKWDAAKLFCDGKGWKFVLWTESGLRHYNPQLF